LPGDRRRSGATEDRHGPGLGCVPSGIAQQRPGENGIAPLAETPQSLGRAEGVQAFGGVPLLLFTLRRRRRHGNLRQQRRERVAWQVYVSRRRGRRRRDHSGGPLAIVFLLDHSCEDELVSMPGHRADEARLARVVPEHTADRADGLAERAVGDGHVRPHRVEDVAAMDGVAAAFDEEDQEVEVARDERLFLSIAQQDASAGREDELAEAVAGHGGR
jgi:hypothetical protein